MTIKTASRLGPTTTSLTLTMLGWSARGGAGAPCPGGGGGGGGPGAPAPPDIADLDWSAFPASAGDDAQAARLLCALIDGLTALAGESTKDLIGRAAREHQFFAAPLLDMAEVASFEQYAARGLWATQPLPEGRQVQAPVRFARFSDYSIELRRPAPPLSGHTQEVLAEAGYSGTEIQALFAHGIV